MSPGAISPQAEVTSDATSVAAAAVNGHFQDGASPDLNGRTVPSHISTPDGSSSNGLSAVTPSSSSPSNGSNGAAIFPPVFPDDELDLLCVGFGPANLAIGIALHDAIKDTAASSIAASTPKVFFLEKNPRFSWHSGMQIPGAKMQISFLKDLATPRDPTSRFTFLNYLKSVGRLNTFINLSTFLPSRVEFEDYLRWCAAYFEHEGCVQYSQEVVSVTASSYSPEGKVTSFLVTAQDELGSIVSRRARNVVIAAGGKPIIPEPLRGLKQVHHSSAYMDQIQQIQKLDSSQQRLLEFAVIGGGQSSAEIFNDLWDRFPQSKVTLVVKGSSLRPSDDSPFVNEIFDPERVDEMYERNPADRAAAISEDRATNYGVVRINLLEHLYEKLYMQRLANPDEATWRCRILTNRNIDSTTELERGERTGVTLHLSTSSTDQKKKYEDLNVDYVFSGTGYIRNAYEQLLESTKSLVSPQPSSRKSFPVTRDYKVMYDEQKVDRNAGVWLQGCNEDSHGLSDSLLSILAIRGGEMVQSVFGPNLAGRRE